MPWEKTFDLDEAVDRAMVVFWRKGYDATSMTDLLEAMQINKGSLYNAFGSKKELFKAAFKKFDAELRQKRLQSLEALEAPPKAIAKLFDRLIKESVADSECKGCLLVNTALELPNHDEDVRELVAAALKDFEAFFKKMIIKGQKQGTIPLSVAPAPTAQSLLALVIGLRVMARTAADAKHLRATKSAAMRLISE